MIRFIYLLVIATAMVLLPNVSGLHRAGMNMYTYLPENGTDRGYYEKYFLERTRKELIRRNDKTGGGKLVVNTDKIYEGTVVIRIGMDVPTCDLTWQIGRTYIQTIPYIYQITHDCDKPDIP